MNLPPLQRLPRGSRPHRARPSPTAKPCADGGGWPHSTGACVIIFSEYKKRACIAVFEDKHSGLLEHAGGGCDPQEEPARAAARELREETGNLFHVPPSALANKPMAQKGEYRAFSLKVAVIDGAGQNAMSRSDFTENMSRILSHKGVSHSWKEMKRMTYIDLSTLLNTGLLSANLHKNHFPTYDVDSKKVLLRDRDAVILRTLWLSADSVPGPATPSLVLRRRTGYDVAKASSNTGYLYRNEAKRTFLNGTAWYGVA